MASDEEMAIKKPQMVFWRRWNSKAVELLISVQYLINRNHFSPKLINQSKNHITRTIWVNNFTNSYEQAREGEDPHTTSLTVNYPLCFFALL